MINIWDHIDAVSAIVRKKYPNATFGLSHGRDGDTVFATVHIAVGKFVDVHVHPHDVATAHVRVADHIIARFGMAVRQEASRNS